MSKTPGNVHTHLAPLGYSHGMAIHMAGSVAEERLRWVNPLVRGEVALRDLLKVCPHSRRSVLRWKAAYLARGRAALVPRSTRPCTHPRETPIGVKERIVALRKRHRWCALKLSWYLAREGVRLHPRTVGKILKAEGLVRRYRKARMAYRYLKAPLRPGELVEIDVKYVPGRVAGRRYFQYTAIDCASRWRHLQIFEEQGTGESITFLQEVMRRFPHRIAAIKTDNHTAFTNWGVGANRRSDRTVKTLHALDRFCAAHGIAHYLIDPGKPAQNGRVERSHREDQEKFYARHAFTSALELRRKLRRWNLAYNNLAHCGLDGRSPNEFLRVYSS